MFWLWSFLIYWLLLFVACYIVAEVGQRHYYDEVTPLVGLKVGGSSLLLAAALTWWETSWKSTGPLDLFLGDVWFTGILAILAFVLFCLAMRFHASHALMLGPATVVLVAFTAAMAVDSFRDTGRTTLRDRPIPPQQRTIRKSAGSGLEGAIEEPPPASKAGRSKTGKSGAPTLKSSPASKALGPTPKAASPGIPRGP